jgi:hypothetical protein
LTQTLYPPTFLIDSKQEFRTKLPDCGDEIAKLLATGKIPTEENHATDLGTAQ